jgi:signal transduction histidine kinase/CheY-like chemotaxis protein
VFNFLRHLFSTEFMPHGMCYFWDPWVLWLNAGADSLIAAAYYAIPFLLFYFIRQRTDVRFKGIFIAFGVFILACGTTHLMGAITIWHPVYRLDGLIKAITAVASVVTFGMIVPLLPALIALPSPTQLEEVNRSLAREIEVRRTAEEEVRKMNDELEERVAKRTAERQALESQLIQSQKMEAVGRLAGGVAHDFNNLLTVILGYAEMLREQTTQDPLLIEYIDEMHLAAHRASDLTNQLLAFSRRQTAVPRIVSLNDVVRQIENMLNRIIGEDVQLDTRLAADSRPVCADPAHIQQVIMNLAINSRDAMPQGGKLTIETTGEEFTEDAGDRPAGIAAGHYTVLAASDTGIGMDEATKAHIFEPFFSTKEKGKGTGLGLSIVYGIVKQNAGEILVSSEPGKGTTFKIYLPAVNAAAESLKTPVQADDIVSGAETVLLVEDDQQVRSLARAMLTSRGYAVLEANSASDALRIAADVEHSIDLLLSDIVMPGMNGTELALRIVAQRPGIRVLFMSGYAEGRSGVLTPETPFIRKPFTSAALHNKLRELLGDRR